MNARTLKYNYTEWFTAEEMHEHSKQWVSELTFVRDEQQFLKNLIQSFAIRPIHKKEFGLLDTFNKALIESHQKLEAIIKQVKKQMNHLEIMMDGVNQLEMEKAYTKTHKKLLEQAYNYLMDYRKIKAKGFVNLSSILNTDKQKLAIGNPKYKLSEIHEEK